LEQELEPKEEQIENLNQQLQEQDGELVEELKRASVCVPAITPLHTLAAPVPFTTQRCILMLKAVCTVTGGGGGRGGGRGGGGGGGGAGVSE